jgi:hypothetical protein
MTSSELSPAKAHGQGRRRSSFAASQQRLPINVTEHNALRIQIRQTAFESTRVAVLSISMLGVNFFELRYYRAGRHAGGWSATTTFWSPAFRSQNRSLNSHDDYQVQLIAQDFLGPLDFKRAPSNTFQEAA